jgi:hypothetical protein
MRYGRVASSVVGSVRNLNLHEYQSIGLLRTHGAKVQNGSVAHSKDIALEVANAILKSDSNADIIVKAQIHAGGRGKGTFTNGFQGGVQIVNSASKAASLAEKMIGNTLVTKQTGEQGQLCQSVLINQVVGMLLYVTSFILHLSLSSSSITHRASISWTKNILPFFWTEHTMAPLWSDLTEYVIYALIVMIRISDV